MVGHLSAADKTTNDSARIDAGYWRCFTVSTMGVADNAATRAEPTGVGTAEAKDPLAREVKLLGSLLCQVIIEQEGLEAFELVERIRRAAIARRRTSRTTSTETLADELAAIDLPQAAILIRA